MVKLLRKDVAGYESAASAEENYPDGFIKRLNLDRASVWMGWASTPTSLVETRNAMNRSMNAGWVRDALVYKPGSFTETDVDKTKRSNIHITEPDLFGNVGYGILDDIFKKIIPEMFCNCGPMSTMPWRALERHKLIYREEDHFDTTYEGFRGHSDDSIYRGGKWVRNQPLRHVVGLIWLTDCVDEVTDPTTQFSGGEFQMPFVLGEDGEPFIIKPSMGRVCFFPANPVYLHYVKKITAGTRMTLTTWYSFEGYK